MTYRVAVCTSDGHEVDLHFGETRRFLIIEVDERDGTWTELEYREAPPRAGRAGHDVGWLRAITDLLSDVAYLWTARIGPRPHRALLAEGVSALEVPTDIEGAVKALGAYRGQRRPGGGAAIDQVPPSPFPADGGLE